MVVKEVDQVVGKTIYGSLGVSRSDHRVIGGCLRVNVVVLA